MFVTTTTDQHRPKRSHIHFAAAHWRHYPARLVTLFTQEVAQVRPSHAQAQPCHSSATLLRSSASRDPLAALCFVAENACNLPAGTLSAGVNCGSAEAGCTVAVLAAASELTCDTGYGGSPAKSGAACNTSGDFTGATFCTGRAPCPRHPHGPRTTLRPTSPDQACESLLSPARGFSLPPLLSSRLLPLVVDGEYAEGWFLPAKDLTGELSGELRLPAPPPKRV